MDLDYSLKPTTDEYLTARIADIFAPVFRGQSVALSVVPKAGTYGLLMYLLNYPGEVSPKFKDKMRQFQFVPVDLTSGSEVESLMSYDRVEGKKKVFFIVNNAELMLENERILSHLASFASKNVAQIGFIMLFSAEMRGEEYNALLSRFGIHARVMVPLKSYDDMGVLLEKEETWFDYEIPDRVKERIARLAGGYSSLARSLLSLANQDDEVFVEMDDNELIENVDVRLRLVRVFEALSSESKKAMMQVILGPGKSGIQPAEYLEGTGILSKDDGGWVFFSDLFEKFVRKQIQENEEFASCGKGLSLCGIDLSSLLSNQEYQVFLRLWEGRGSVVTREEIAKTMWAKEWADRYSDWAIDQVIFNIRRKLLLGKDALESVKGKGVCLDL